MNVKECYEAIGGDYESMKRRFLKDDRIQRFALMFLKDGSMDDLREGMREKDCDKAFLAAHTLKGVCLNLGLTGLQCFRESINAETVLKGVGNSK